MMADSILDAAASDQRKLAQVAQYWQRCNDARVDGKQLSRSLSATDTHISDDEEDEDEDEDVIDIGSSDDDDVEQDGEYEYRYVHYRRRSSRGASVISGLPLLCGNCGVSFFSLQSQSLDDDDDCYCSGECKWSVIMYRDMDRRMSAMRTGRARANLAVATAGCDANGSFPYATDDAIPCH